jgi:hypothetical protein
MFPCLSLHVTTALSPFSVPPPSPPSRLDADVAGIQSKIAMLFLSLLFPSVVNLNTSFATSFELREVYYREQASRSYPSWTYSVSIGTGDMCVQIAGASHGWLLVGTVFVDRAHSCWPGHK